MRDKNIHKSSRVHKSSKVIIIHSTTVVRETLPFASLTKINNHIY